MTAHPPRPRLTLRIGITGHRPNKLDAGSLPRLRQQIADVFEALQQAADAMRQEAEAFYNDEPAVVRLVSGYAEGADLIAVAACPAGWQIEAILPFPKDDYLQDFTTKTDGYEARAEFLDRIKQATAVTELPAPPAAMRDLGYAHAGSYLLRQIDVLVAIWDGLAPKPGGTGAIAREAHAAGIPVVWLASGDARPPRLISAFDGDGVPEAASTDCTAELLAATLNPNFLPLAADQPRSTGPEGLKRYVGERWRKRCIFTTYDALRRIAQGRWPQPFITHPPFEQRLHDWDEFLKQAPAAGNLQQRLTTVLLPRHIWADTLAVHYSHLYRSAYVFAYLLSALAVFIALTTVFIHEGPGESPRDVLAAKAIIVGCELVVIGLIILAVSLGRRLTWHERWLNYRMLAEMLRHGRFLAFVSEFGRSQEVTPQRHQLWMLWYIRATMREIGLPTATLDADYRARILNATLVDEITGPKGQFGYHQQTGEAVHHIDHLLHRLGVFCFVATSIILIAFLALFALQQALGLVWLESFLMAAKPLVTFFSAGLPALGAAVAGIRVHGDFEGLTERSNKMVGELGRLKDDYAEAMAHGASLNESADLLIQTAGLMSEDLAIWQALYGRKRLALPA